MGQNDHPNECNCVVHRLMRMNPNATEADVLQVVIQDARHRLCHEPYITMYAPPKDGIPYAYTVGLSRMSLPELLVVGLTRDPCAAIFSNVVDWMMAQGGLVLEHRGAYNEHEVPTLGFAELGPMPRATIMPMVGKILDCKADNFRAYQALWPDTSGRLPWHEGFDPHAVQPIIGAGISVPGQGGVAEA